MHSCNYRLRNCAMSSLTVHGQLCKSCSLEFWTVNWIAHSKGMHNATLQITRKTNLNCQYSRWIINFQTKTPRKRDHREGEIPFLPKHTSRLKLCVVVNTNNSVETNCLLYRIDWDIAREEEKLSFVGSSFYGVNVCVRNIRNAKLP